MKTSIPDHLPGLPRPPVGSVILGSPLVSDADGAASMADSLSTVVSGRRRELGLSLRQLGEQSGVNFSWLSRIENGRARVMPSLDAIIGLASSLQLSVAELLIRCGVDPKLVLPSDKRVRELRTVSISPAHRAPAEADQ